MSSLIKVTDTEFNLIRDFVYDTIGIVLSNDKRTLVVSRLNKRLRHYNFNNYLDYFNFVKGDSAGEEKQIFIDLITTNETYFFREEQHFDVLKTLAKDSLQNRDDFSLWCGAASSGEEPYSLAMTLADTLDNRKNWRILATDINTTVLQKAQRGHYAMERIDGIPKLYLKRYCLKGVGKQQGTLLIDPALRKKVTFEQYNLLFPAGKMGRHDVIFLRNVLIYFDDKTKRQVVANLLKHLKPRGHLIIGLSDKFDRTGFDLELVKPSVFLKPN